MRALHQAERLWRQYCRTADLTGTSLQTCKADVERTGCVNEVKSRAPFTLIILANCLNEIHTDTTDPIEGRTRLVTELLALLAPQGTMMIVEPALRETSRALHQVRDRLLQEKRCTVYSPCLHENNCPALVNPYDWCHEERAWEPPVSIQEIDCEVGFIKDALKFSYLLLRKDGKTIVDRQPDVYRVVSELRELKGLRSGPGSVTRQDGPKSAGRIAWPRLRTQRLMSGIAVQSYKLKRSFTKNEGERCRYWGGSSRMLRCKLFALSDFCKFNHRKRVPFHFGASWHAEYW